jgi:hypothetical protein
MVYAARYGWNWLTEAVVVAVLATSGVAVALDMPLVLRVAVVGFFAGCALMADVVSSRRRLALRVDASGVTIHFPLGFRPRRVPWPDAVAVVFWSQQVSARVQPYVGVLPRAEAKRGFGRFSRAAVGDERLNELLPA